jgi:small-conductance mechanosensitive channel
MDRYSTELWWALGLLSGVVLTAALVNRLRPQHRSRLRRLVTLFVLFLVALAGSVAFKEAQQPDWANGFFIGSEVLRAFLLVNIGATLAFTVLFPVTGLVLPMIASDLLVGIGYAVATIGVMSGHGVNPNSALVSGAVVSGVLAISLQSTLGNILGGVALQLDGSIHEGDWVQLENGRQGKVSAIRWRHTVIETRDWSTIIVPNAQLLGSAITILGKRMGDPGPQRMWVWFNVDYRFPPTRVIEVVSDGILDSPIENVAENPKPSVVCMDFTRDMRESVATYAVRYWIKDLATDDPTNSRVRARIYTALRRAGIPLAVPAHTAFVEMHDYERQKKHDEHELDKRLVALQTVHLFAGFSQDELRMLAGSMSHMLYTTNERITRQGATAHWLYVMTAGSAEIRVHDKETTTTIAHVTAPDFFGEMGLMTGEPRSADVIATTDVECFRLGKDGFEKVLLGRPEIVGELSEKLASRRVELLAKKEGLDAAAKRAREASERARIVNGIKSFFGL